MSSPHEPLPLSAPDHSPQNNDSLPTGPILKSNGSPYFKIDIHTHVLPRHLPDLSRRYNSTGWIQVKHDDASGRANMYLDGKFFRTVESNCCNCAARLPECDKAGVDVQVLSTVPVMFNYNKKPEHTLDLARYLNDHLAQCVAENPRRFTGLGTLPMQAPDLAVAELKRCVEELGLRGVQIGSHINDWNLDAPELEPFWTACEELDAAVFVHPWDMTSNTRMEKYWFPWLVMMPCETTIAICSLLLGGVLERHPRLKVCFAHGGGSFPGTVGRIEHGFQCRPDLVAVNTTRSPLSMLDRIWVDSLVHDRDALMLLVKKFGVGRVLMGSDYPFPLGEIDRPGRLIEEIEELTEDDKDRMLSRNALEFLGLKEEDFH
ncbi:hypothetical protein HDU93_001258 [Gonapodya sp. JEL0774]|nr:hypothetical protein HDU93_001258 [Gonapodya sp. JEL0774]